MVLQRSRVVTAPTYVLRWRKVGPLATRQLSALTAGSSVIAGGRMTPGTHEVTSYRLRNRSNVVVRRGRHLNTCTALCSGAVDASVSAAGTGSTGLTASAAEAGASVTSGADTVTFETSAPAKWAADATPLAELPPQGDLASLGLCANTPVGWLQSMMEYVHVHMGLPWWFAIIASTFLLRAAIFPVMMKAQKNGVVLNNVNPEIQQLMKKQRAYRQVGNQMLAELCSMKIWKIYQKNKCNPLKMAVMPLIQLPLFVSFFMAVRKMAAVPVESMKTGGVLWFQDLTVADPYYVLPVLACGSFVASIELGGETGVGNPQTARLKNFFRLMPIILIPVTASFPTGIFMYWLPASFISIAQTLLLRVKRVRSFFGIPQIIVHPPEAQEESKGVMGYFKESYSSSLAIAEAKQKKKDAMKRYNKLKKNPRPKLYDRPPHLIRVNE